MLAEVSARDLERLKVIVREETGNQVEEKNHSMLVSRIRGRMTNLGIPSMDEYWQHFADHEAEEREALRGLMTTHYTFFFREFVHFEKLREWIQSNANRLRERHARTQEPVRVWSAACSRGQEVYSLAFFLELELKTKYGVPFKILGTDIDPESVRYAQNAVYPLKEVNTIPAIYLSRFWKKGTGQVKDFAAVHPSVRERVEFDTLNLLELGAWANSSRFDVIFCRNVFIYFSESNVQKIALGLASRLADGGLLITGLSEPLRFPGWTLQVVGPSCYSASATALAPLGTDEASSAKGSAAAAPAGASGAKVQDLTMSAEARYRVLVVDDSATIQLLMKKIFSQDPQCREVVVAGNGREAAEKLKRERFELITLDIHMPEVNGLEFLERHYDAKTHPPVIMVSSVNRSDLELATKSLQLGAFDYVEKPAMNALQKSATEILTKAKMALRSRSTSGAAPKVELEFEQQIAQRIVVPDASACLRVVLADLTSPSSRQSLEWVVRGQDKEYRSPALLIVHSGTSASAQASGSRVEEDVTSHQAAVLSWTNRAVMPLRGSNRFLRPNTIYLSDVASLAGTLSEIRANSLSLQILAPLREPQWIRKEHLSRFSHLQILVDENCGLVERRDRPVLEASLGAPLGDWCPATSFASLSLEFFAHLRKAAA
jgi:chemotaxis protein methyltransferase CheR